MILGDRPRLPEPGAKAGEEAVPQQLEVGEEDEQHRHDGDLPDGRKVKPEEADDRDHHGHEHVEADVGERAADGLSSPCGEVGHTPLARAKTRSTHRAADARPSRPDAMAVVMSDIFGSSPICHLTGKQLEHSSRET